MKAFSGMIITLSASLIAYLDILTPVMEVVSLIVGISIGVLTLIKLTRDLRKPKPPAES